MLERVKLAAKSALSPVLYRYRPFNLRPARLAFFLTALLDRAQLDTNAAEIGCSVRRTATVGARCWHRQGGRGSITCFDTFSGFVDEQYDTGVATFAWFKAMQPSWRPKASLIPRSFLRTSTWPNRATR